MEVFEALSATVGNRLADLIDPAHPENVEIRAAVEDAMRGMVLAKAAGDAPEEAAARRRLLIAAQAKLTQGSLAKNEMMGVVIDTALLFATNVAAGGLASLAAGLRDMGD